MNRSGTESQIAFEWPLAPWAILALLALLLLAVAWTYARLSPLPVRRRIGLGMLRLLVVLIVAAATLDWKLERYRTDLPDLYVVIDTSASMAEPDGLGGLPEARASRWRRELGVLEPVSRLDAVKKTLLYRRAKWMERAAKRYELQVVAMDERRRRLDATGTASIDQLSQLAADGTASPIGDQLRELILSLRGTPTAAIVCFTDGAVTSGLTLAEAAAVAERHGIALKWIGVGSSESIPDVALEEVVVEEAVFLDDLVRFDVRLRATELAGREIAVRVVPQYATDQTSEQQVLVRGDDEALVTRIWLRADRPGVQKFVVEAATDVPERDTSNNRKIVSIEVKDEPLNVLLVAERPAWDFRLLKDRLERLSQSKSGRRHIALSSVIQESDPEYAREDAVAIPVVPVGKEQLARFDVIVLCDANLQLLGHSTLQHMRHVVEVQGHGLVLVAGPRQWPHGFRGTPFEPLLPATVDQIETPPDDRLLVDEYRVEPTRVGQLHPALQLSNDEERIATAWKALPGLRWLSRLRRLRGGAQVLLQTRARGGAESWPVLVTRYVGKGQIAYLLTDESYRWGRGPEGDAQLDRFWLQLLRELGRRRIEGQGRGVHLTTDRRRYRAGDPIRVRARFSEPLPIGESDSVFVDILRADGHRVRRRLRAVADQPGEFAGTVPFLAPGSYRIGLVRPGRSIGRDGSDGPADVDAAEVGIEVASANLEAQYRMRDQRALEAATQRKESRVYELDEFEAMLRSIPRGTPTRIDPLPGRTIWNRLPVLLLIVTLLATEWLLRKSWGLA